MRMIGKIKEAGLIKTIFQMTLNIQKIEIIYFERMAMDGGGIKD